MAADLQRKTNAWFAIRMKKLPTKEGSGVAREHNDGPFYDVTWLETTGTKIIVRVCSWVLKRPNGKKLPAFKGFGCVLLQDRTEGKRVSEVFCIGIQYSTI